MDVIRIFFGLRLRCVRFWWWVNCKVWIIFSVNFICWILFNFLKGLLIMFCKFLLLVYFMMMYWILFYSVKVVSVCIMFGCLKWRIEFFVLKFFCVVLGFFVFWWSFLIVSCFFWNLVLYMFLNFLFFNNLLSWSLFVLKVLFWIELKIIFLCFLL